MRVVAGKHRSRPLLSPKNKDVRPTTDMIKESVFNIIQNDVVDCKFLDLFAGSGAIGIEAISRGAKKVVFVDNSKESLNIVKTNLQTLKEDAQVIFSDFENALARLRGNKFDIIYLDPPFCYTDIANILTQIKQNELLEDTGIVIYESLFDKNFDKTVQGFNIIKSKKYGAIAIDIYEEDK